MTYSGEKHRSVWNVLSTQASTLYRFRRWRRIAVVFAVYTLLLLTWQQYDLRREKSIKNQPTKLKTQSGSGDAVFQSSWQRQQRSREGCTYQKALGSGREGRASVYECDGDLVVVKEFYGLHSVNRNILPEALHTQLDIKATFWPAEIETSLHLSAQQKRAGLVPLHDYFLGCPGDDQGRQRCETPQWYSIQPLIAQGDLGSFARHVHASSLDLKASSLDALYRPAFECLLLALGHLHGDEQLCHDDIRPSNIFVSNSSQFLIGDLGQARQITHLYHTTSIWSTSQWQDCRLNDVRRALKTYLGFLRASCHDPDAFDNDFINGHSPWSRLYWSFLARPLSAQALFEKSQRFAPQSARASDFKIHHTADDMAQAQEQVAYRGVTPPLSMPARWIMGYRRTLRFAVSQELLTKIRTTPNLWLTRMALLGWALERPVLHRGCDTYLPEPRRAERGRT